MLIADGISQPRDIKAGEMTYGERLELVRALSDDSATGYERISRVIGTLHGFIPDPGQAAKLASYVEEVSEAVKGWLRREAEECHVPPTADERAAGVDLLAKETGEAVMKLLEKNIRPRDILTPAALTAQELRWDSPAAAIRLRFLSPFACCVINARVPSKPSKLFTFTML